MSGSSAYVIPTLPDPSLILSTDNFRTLNPEFSNTTTFPDLLVSLWLKTAQTNLDPVRWADMYIQGIQFYVAHQLTLAARNNKPGAQGSSGLPLSKTVGRGSIDYDTTAVTLKDGGPWNLTSYGTQLLYWARLVGSGGIQVTGDLLSGDNILGVNGPGGVLGAVGNSW